MYVTALIIPIFLYAYLKVLSILECIFVIPAYFLKHFVTKNILQKFTYFHNMFLIFIMYIYIFISEDIKFKTAAEALY